MLETLQVVFLAPALTAGAISLEREKQTLDLLVVTPISSLAIVIGKLFKDELNQATGKNKYDNGRPGF